MLLTVPRSALIYPPGYGGDVNQLVDIGLMGLGDTLDTINDLPVTAPGTIDPNTDLVTPQQLQQELNTVSPAGALVGPQYGGSSAVQDITAATNAAAAAARALAMSQQPNVIPGTSAIYNPATGQITSALGTNLTAATAPLSAISSYIPLFLGVGVVIAVLSVLKK